MKGQTFTTMDGLRGVAAVMVVLFHAPGTRPFVESAYLAVDLFFALSGFVLAHSSLEKLTTLGAAWPFMKKRIIRLYPLFAVGLGLGVLAYSFAALLNGDFWPSRLALGTALHGLFLPAPPQFSLNTEEAYPINIPSWSLAFEMLINVAFGLLAFAYTARRLGLIILASALGLIAASFANGGLDGGPDFPTFYVGLARVLFSFSLGVAIYRLWASGRFTIQVPWWLSVGALVAVLCLPLPSDLRPIGDLVIVLLVFPAILSTATGTNPLPFLQYLGRVSYGVYILHMPILNVMRTASNYFLGLELDSFGVLGSLALLVAVFGLATVLDPLDAFVRHWLTSVFMQRGRRNVSLST